MTNTITSPSGKVLHHRATMKTTPKESTEAKEVRVRLSQAKRIEENRAYLKNANVKAFLDTVTKTEGGDYHAKFGWIRGKPDWTFADESTHPGFGKGGKFSASGRYQINLVTWKEQGGKHQGLTDFSPDTQDLIAVDLIRSHHAMEPLIDGDLKTVVNMLKAAIWTSLQAYDYADVKAFFEGFGGVVK